MGYQIAFPGIGIAFTNTDIFRILELPDPVILQSPERILRVVAFSGRPEINEELFELFVYFSVRDETLAVSKAPCQSVEKEQGFMRRALGAPLPDGDVSNEGFEVAFVHIISANNSFLLARKNRFFLGS